MPLLRRVAGMLCLLVLPLVPFAARAQGSSSMATGGLDSVQARVLVDSLFRQVSQIRELEPLRSLDLVVADRARIRTRLEEITREDEVRNRARGDERLMKYLGLLPEDVDLLTLYMDLLEEQLAGMYDVDERLLYLADWLPLELQGVVAVHEITHALQDQHFSLRVRKRLGFDSPDAEAAWQALLEGDATAVMLEVFLRPFGQSFAMLADSTMGMQGSLAEIMQTALSAGAGFDTQQLFTAPRSVREALLFPYQFGLPFVAALYAQGGWKRVDDTYVHPPESTEQLMHPAQFLDELDGPIRVELPDLRGLLGRAYSPEVELSLGEFDLRLYLGEYMDADFARICSEGWGGSASTLYTASDGSNPAFVLSTIWDSEDDATEFFGALLGVMEVRFPEQEGVPDVTSPDFVVWNADKQGRFQNVVRQNGRSVSSLEGVPAATMLRIVQKLDQQTRFEDPTPDVRALRREQLPWNRKVVPAVSDSGLTLDVDLPPGWEPVEAATGPGVLFTARKAGGSLEVGLDRAATDRLGAGGYAHVLAENIQQRGSEVYVQTDVVYPRKDGSHLYQHIFSQTEDGQKRVYYIGAVELEPGFGYVLLEEPEDGVTPVLDGDFYRILDTLRLIPMAAAAGATGG